MKVARHSVGSAVGVVGVSLWLLFCCSATAELHPIGTNVGPVQFDAVIELDPPFAQTHVLLFARYWVASDYYYLGVVWAEPHGTGLCFPIYPPTLSIGSDSNSFSIDHGVYETNAVSYPKPLPDRGAFGSMFGDY